MSSGAGEHRGFVFALTFMVVFAALLASVPSGLMGPGEEVENVTPVDPNLLSGFASSVDWNTSYYTGYPLSDYEYSLGGRQWITHCFITEDILTLGAKDLIGGILWLGGVFYCYFVSPAGINRDTSLSFAEIDADSSDGGVRYSMYFEANGNSAGDLVIYWDSNIYTDAEDAWDNDAVFFLHGVGFAESATSNIGSLIVSLLLFQLPDCPTLVNVLIATPIWASVIFLIWYIIKEMIPFA